MGHEALSSRLSPGRPMREPSRKGGVYRRYRVYAATAGTRATSSSRLNKVPWSGGIMARNIDGLSGDHKAGRSSITGSI